MPLLTFLDVSTAHLTSPDLKVLEGYGADGQRPETSIVAYPYQYGWIVCTSMCNERSGDEVRTLCAEAGFSDYFTRMVQHAHSLGAQLLRYDADGIYEPGFVAFDHENADALIDTGDDPEIHACEHWVATGVMVRVGAEQVRA